MHSFLRFGIEELLLKYNVDLALWAHEHDYERFWPVYNLTVYNGSISEPYTNPRAPIHIISGSAVRFFQVNESVTRATFNYRDAKKSMILGCLNLTLLPTGLTIMVTLG